MQRKSSLIHSVFLFLIILTLPVFLFKQFRVIRAKKHVELNYHHDSFVNPDNFIKEDKRFVIVIVGSNSEDLLEQSLKSTLSQEYTQYRVVYIDDDSSIDGVKIAKKFIASHEKKDKVTIAQQSSKETFCETYYSAIQECNDDDVIVHLNAGDWLSHDYVLTRLNKAYQHQDVWLTYGQYLEYPSYKKGGAMPQPRRAAVKKKVQRAPFLMSHLKTYYAGLFKQIQLQEDVKKDYLLSMQDESKLMIPMVELAKNNVRFIPEVLYVHYQKPAKEEMETLTLAAFCEQFAGALAPPAGSICEVEEPFFEEISLETDLLIFSNNHPHQLHVCLDSVARFAHGIKSIKVIYVENGESHENYEGLKKNFTYVTFIKQNLSQGPIYKSLIMNTIFKQGGCAKYVALATDGVIINSDISFAKCIAALEKNKAYAFYLHLGKDISKSRDKEMQIDTIAKKLGEGVFSWEIESGKGR
ncbi:MAG: glycosyltransferase family 2 protein, partial [Simkaniaceae bacterium]|nr:glycosyltransferase family 2 protein [Simkaniaceae bacterium]